MIVSYSARGLSDSEVRERQRQGLSNQAPGNRSRSYLQIVRESAFTFVNTVLFTIGVILLIMGQYGDALVTACLVVMSMTVVTFQETRAKRKLDRIALLTRPHAVVIRDGTERDVDPSEIVQGDVLSLRSGDQVIVDGPLLTGGPVEVDESLLSGESQLVAKGPGDLLYSGSFCVTGVATYHAEKVGGDSYANQITAGARAFKRVLTPLQQDINAIVRVLCFLVTQLALLLALYFAISNAPLVEGLRASAVVVAMVPQGLLFMTTVAYAMGAVRVSGKSALIQRANAVESVSNVDLLCLDKTGTLTTNRIKLQGIVTLRGASAMTETEIRRILGDCLASTQDRNRTAEAIAEAWPGKAWTPVDSVPFSSQRKWSALCFDQEGPRGSYVLGAPEVLEPVLEAEPALRSLIGERTALGLRVVLFARREDVASLRNASGEPELPANLVALAILSLGEELRPEAKETMDAFSELGIGIKIISGDHPDTVTALARQAGISGFDRAISGQDLADVDDAHLSLIAEENAIFGRTTPEQKERLVKVLKDRGHYVAMIGDGVNDVLSLKQAHTAISIESGSAAARGVSDIVLLKDSFGALPLVFREGQRIVRGMSDVVKLLLSRTIYMLLLIIASRIVGLAFPVTPKHNSILALMTVGLPILGIAAWAHPGQRPRSIIKASADFIFPAGFTVSAVSLAVYVYYTLVTHDLVIAQNAMNAICLFCGLLLIPFLIPPSRAWVAETNLSGDWRPTKLAIGMFGFYVLSLIVPPFRTFFELRPLPLKDYLVLAMIAVVWGIAIREIWRQKVMGRLMRSSDTMEENAHERLL